MLRGVCFTQLHVLWDVCLHYQLRVLRAVCLNQRRVPCGVYLRWIRVPVLWIDSSRLNEACMLHLVSFSFVFILILWVVTFIAWSPSSLITWHCPSPFLFSGSFVFCVTVCVSVHNPFHVAPGSYRCCCNLRLTMKSLNLIHVFLVYCSLFGRFTYYRSEELPFPRNQQHFPPVFSRPRLRSVRTGFCFFILQVSFVWRVNVLGCGRLKFFFLSWLWCSTVFRDASRFIMVSLFVCGFVWCASLTLAKFSSIWLLAFAYNCSNSCSCILSFYLSM